MRDSRFGRTGEAPTEFEMKLLAGDHRVEEIWASIGRKIGAAALFTVFAELGGEVVSVPTRENFMHRLYLPMRDAEILALAEREKLTDVEIGRRYSMTGQAVADARKRALRTLRGAR